MSVAITCSIYQGELQAIAARRTVTPTQVTPSPHTLTTPHRSLPHHHTHTSHSLTSHSTTPHRSLPHRHTLTSHSLTLTLSPLLTRHPAGPAPHPAHAQAGSGTWLCLYSPSEPHPCKSRANKLELLECFDEHNLDDHVCKPHAQASV